MKRRVEMSAVLLALLFALTVILSPRPAYAGGFSISPEEVEKSVARIRGWYYAEDYDSNGSKHADMARHSRNSRQRISDEAVGKVSKEADRKEKVRSNAYDKGGILCQDRAGRAANYKR